MSAGPVKFTQTHQAMALARRLSQAGANVFAALRHVEDLALSAQAVDALCAPPDTGAALKGLLNRKDSGADPGKRHRSAAPRFGDRLKAERASEPTRLSAVPKDGKRAAAPSTPENHRAKPAAFKPPQTKAKSRPQPDAAVAGSARPPGNPTAQKAKHKAKTSKDIVDFRRLQRREALTGQTQPEGTRTKPAQTTAPTVQPAPKDKAEFASLAEFSRAKAKATYSQYSGTAKGVAQNSTQPVSQIHSTFAEENNGSSLETDNRPTYPDMPEPRPKPMLAQSGDTDQRTRSRPEDPPIGQPTRAQDDSTPPAVTAAARPVTKPAEKRARAKALRLSDNATAMREAAWRNGVDPQ